MVLAALIATASFKYPPAATITVTFGTMNIIPALSAVMSALETRSIAPNHLNNYIIITITNIYGNYLFLLFNLNTNSLFSVNNSSLTKLANNTFTQYAFLTKWAERIYLGPNLNPNSSKIKGSFTGFSNINVSYMNSYSVPITCSSEGIAVTGYNINLFT